MEAEKPCCVCGETKPLSEFHKSKRRLDGHNPGCKVCVSEYGRQYRKDNASKLARYFQEHYVAHREEKRAYNRQYFIDHRDEILVQNRQYYADHRNEILAYKQQCYKDNPEKARAVTRAWQEANPEKVRAMGQRRRAYEVGASGNGVTAEEFAALCEVYGNTCLCCGRNDVKLTLDHIIPLSKGGVHDISNIQPLCRSCNSSKSAKSTDYR